MQKWARMIVETDKAFVDPSEMMTQMRRGLRLLELATFNDLVLANTSGHHKASKRWTWHSPNRQHHNQTDYILVRKPLLVRSEHCQNTVFQQQTLEVTTTC